MQHRNEVKFERNALSNIELMPAIAGRRYKYDFIKT